MKRKSVREMMERYWPEPPKYEVEAAGERMWKRISAELDKHDMSLRSLYGDGWNAPKLNSSEFQLLSRVARLAAEGRHVTFGRIQESVETMAGQAGAVVIYCTLKVLEWRGLVTVDRQTWPPYYDVTRDGKRGLARSQAQGQIVSEVLVHTYDDVL